MFPWGWSVLSVPGDDGVAIIPGRGQFLARGSSTHRGMSDDEIAEWQECTSRGDFWEGVDEFVRVDGPYLVPILDRPTVRAEIRRRT
eukprot:4592412-Alexandrium_andersonii.AAC.1